MQPSTTPRRRSSWAHRRNASPWAAGPLAGVLLTAALVGCGGGDAAGPAASGGATSPPGAATSAVLTTPSVTPQPSATTPPTTGPTSTEPTSALGAPTSSSAPAPRPTTAAPVRWPKALGEPQHGQAVWAVYLDVGHSATDPTVELAVKQAASVGYRAVVGDIACDGGAMAALRLDQFDFWSGAALYFASEADARAFVAAYTPRVRAPRGVAKVSVGCLD